MTAYQVVLWSSERLDPVVELHSRTFDLEPDLSLRYLRWKYFSNPYLAEPTLFVATNSGGQVVGMRGFYGTCWRDDGHFEVIPCADDFAIAGADRNTGLMTQLMREAIDAMARRGHVQLLNLSGGKSTVLQALAAGWRSLGPMKPVARLTRAHELRQQAARQLGVGRLPARLRRLWKRRSVSDFRRLDAAGGAPDGVCIECSPRIEAMVALAHRQDHDPRIRHVRDAAWYRWRFESPMREYRFLYHERDGELDGYLILHRHRIAYSGRLPYYIVDCEAESDDVRARLLRTAVDRGGFQALGSWTASLSAPQVRMLAEFGFEEAEMEARARGMPCALVKTLSPGSARGLSIDGSTWDIRLADSMHG